MAYWAIGVQISGSRIDGEGLLRLEALLKRNFPEFDADCALWSGHLGIRGVVKAQTPTQALETTLDLLGTAFDRAGVDMEGVSEITDVTIRRGTQPRPPSDPNSLPRALLRRVSPSHRT